MLCFGRGYFLQQIHIVARYKFMAKCKTYRITSLMMALLMLLSSTGFSMDLHFCQGQLKSFSFWGEAASCHTLATKSHCHKKMKTCHVALAQNNDVKGCKKDCCSNTTIEMEHSDELQTSQKLEITPTQFQFLSAFVQVYVLRNTERNKAIIPYLNYVPPLLNKDIPVLIQSFLL